jgi:hypothetical protein
VVKKSRSLCGLWHLDGEGVHQRPKWVGALPFCAAARVKGVVEVAVSDELMLGGYGGGKRNRVRFD